MNVITEKGLSGYLKNIWSGFYTCLKGMTVTWRYFWKKPVTYEYPETREEHAFGKGLPEGPPAVGVAPRFRGIHRLEQEECIACMNCNKACPVECIEVGAKRLPGRVLEWESFRIDYGLCLFCGLCVEACPPKCLSMGNEYSLIRFKGSNLALDLLSWRGLREKDRKALEEAQKKKEQGK